MFNFDYTRTSFIVSCNCIALGLNSKLKSIALISAFRYATASAKNDEDKNKNKKWKKCRDAYEDFVKRSQSVNLSQKKLSINACLK